MVASLKIAHDILKSKKLNITDIRCRVLMLLGKSGNAFTQKEIEEFLEKEMGAIDRVTLYRTIRIFIEKQVIHPIMVDAQTIKLKLAGNHRGSDHPHFYCSHCQKLVCMPQIKIEQIMLPKGFVMQSSNVLIDGVCETCSSNVTLRK